MTAYEEGEPYARVGGPCMKESIEAFSRAHVLVVGDCIVDAFLWGTVSRISPEAPVPVVEVVRETTTLGGAANVLANIVALGGRATLCGVVGDDSMADRFLAMVENLGMDTAGIVRADDRPTMVKTRVIAHSQQVVRFDRERRRPLEDGSLARVLAFLDRTLDDYDAVVVSDYAKGMICPPVMEALRSRLGRPPRRPLVVDPKPAPGREALFRHCSIVTPNQAEAARLAGMEIADEAAVAAAGRHILEDLGCEAVLITRGEAGMTLLEGNGAPATVPTQAREVFDVTGAGDTVVAVLALGLAVGMGYRQAAMLANYGAGIVVGKVGTATVSAEELKEAIG